MKRGPTSAARPLQLHIERLTVIGAPMTALESRQFGAALGHELERLARAPGWSAISRSVSLPGAIAAAVDLSAAPTPARLGRDVARSLFDAMRDLR